MSWTSPTVHHPRAVASRRRRQGANHPRQPGARAEAWLAADLAAFRARTAGSEDVDALPAGDREDRADLAGARQVELRDVDAGVAGAGLPVAPVPARASSPSVRLVPATPRAPNPGKATEPRALTPARSSVIAAPAMRRPPSTRSVEAAVAIHDALPRVVRDESTDRDDV
ncbi:MAG: hypothetical protein H6709_01980 [Kofleriaceae bacterium]|nr:hypothetical protein [Kofleriaceae bacterium]